MGNQLVAYAPSLIRPVEYYLSDVPDLIFESHLGSTRFLKVCRAKQENLLFVVKVFVIHEHLVPIQVYCERLKNLRNLLTSSPSPNCLPFTRTKATDRSVIVVRPYVKYSLYDRMSTRPFIQWPEKLWIAFQLLCGLVQIHKHRLSHGDLKLENILITPGLRLLLCDFAPFKPVYLPRNNPSAIFGFFFDTAGRRCCYVAPERFHDDKSRLGADNLLTQEDELKHILLPSMDIFSAGCCLIELFTEGNVPFDLSQLLSFCAGEYEPSAVIEHIENPHARDLVSHMVQFDPSKRSTAEEYLIKFRDLLFPDVFYSTLQSYFDILAFQPLTKPDSRMVRLTQDIRNLPDDVSLSLIFTSLVTAEVRGLRTTTAKLCALESFRILSSKLSDESILERVIPYIVYLLSDMSSHRVRAEALNTLVECLSLVEQVPPSDYNIFSGYIFPALYKNKELDKDVAVRISMARNIARLAQISMRYLEASFVHDPEGLSEQQPQFVSELRSQRETIASFLGAILTDPDPVVKRAWLSTPGSLEALCTYFGRGKAHDILLSHLITFLNDKDDAQLRIAFFRSVPAVAAFIGWHAAPLLIPLLKQGLSDVEEFVMREALLTIKSLAEINFFGRRFLLDLLDETLLFTIHPNLWLRNASAGVITSIKNNLSQVDVHCHVIPKLKAYLKPSVHSIWGVNEISILSKAREPLERQVYESCARSKGPLLSSTIEFLQTSDGKGAKPDSNEVANFIIRLRAEGLPHPLDSIYPAFLHRHVFKVNNQRCLRQTQTMTNNIYNSGLTITSSSAIKGLSMVSALNFVQPPPTQSHILTLSSPPIKEIPYNPSNSTVSGSDTFSSQGPYSVQTLNNSGSAVSFQANLQTFSEKPRGVLVAHLHEHRCSIHKVVPLTSFKGLFASCSRENVRIWDAEKMEGRNVANRSRCIIKLPGDVLLTSVAYAAGSNIIGITDDKDLHGFCLENMVARSVFTLALNNNRDEVGIPVALESCAPNLFLVGTELGALIGFDTRIATKEVFRLKSDLKSGLLTALTSDEDHNWMCTGTSKGILTCWDLRFSIPVNTIKTDAPVRVLKTSPFHPSGVFSASRTQNEVSVWNLETGSRHLCFWASPLPPLSQSTSESAIANTASQIGAPLRNQVPSSQQMHSIMGMTFVKSKTLSAVVTGGTDMCLRWWDVNSPADSSILMSPEKAEQQISGIHRNGEFRFRLVDGVEVIHDVSGAGRSASVSGHGGGNSPSGLGPGSPGLQKRTDSAVSPAGANSGTVHSIVMGNSHHNSITDVSTVSTPNQTFILTSSSDGVIKVWK